MHNASKPLFPKEETMAEASGAMTGKPLIESDRVEGTTVYVQSDHCPPCRVSCIECSGGRVKAEYGPIDVLDDDTEEAVS
jgi:hypothetical protein